MNRIDSLFRLAAGADRLGMNVLRAGLILVLVWIGSLKVAEYEADGIVPFVANSPVMSFFYRFEAPEYRQHMNREGELIHLLLSDVRFFLNPERWRKVPSGAVVVPNDEGLAGTSSEGDPPYSYSPWPCVESLRKPS